MRYLLLMACFTLSLVAHAADKTPASWRDPVTGMQFVSVPKGCFQMGNKQAVEVPFHYDGPELPLKVYSFQFNDELPQHEVCLDAFWMGRHEVRSEEWQRIMGGPAEKPGMPVVKVNWKQAAEFAQRLTERSGGKYHYRLPTEAEWEYACRAGGARETVAIRDELSDRAWYDGKSEAQAVGKLAANAFGLHDMLGNVWEWVQDDYQSSAYARHGLFNPVTQVKTSDRVIRGASYRSKALHARCSKRGHYDAAQSMQTIGLRLVRSP